MMATAVNAMANPIAPRRGKPLISHMCAGDCGYPSSEANVHAAIMNELRHAASIRYSGQCLPRALRMLRLNASGRSLGYLVAGGLIADNGSLGDRLIHGAINRMLTHGCLDVEELYQVFREHQVQGPVEGD